VKKIRLDPEALAVQSFVTVRSPGMRGTVRGADDSLVGAPTQGWNCESRYNCESGNCAGTLEGVCFTDRCTEPCVLEPWTEGQDTCAASCENCEITGTCA
jgi:hypothetical protein